MALDPQDRDAIVDAITAGFAKATPSKTQTPSPDGPNPLPKVSTSLTKSVSGFGRVLDQGGGSLTAASKDFANMLPNALSKVGSAGTSIIKTLEDSQTVFQNMAKVGGGLGGDLGQIRAEAGKARMPLDAFANMVSNNSAALAGLGGSVGDGAKRFADLSNAMFEEGVIDGFMNLGYNIQEANEFVMKNTELTRRSAMLSSRSDAEQVKTAQELAKNMSIVSKLTGKDAKQMQDDLMNRQRDGATQAKLRLLEMDGVTGAQDAYNAAQTSLNKGPAVLKNLFDDLMQTGAPMTEATKNFAATNQEAYELARQAAEANKRGDVAEAQRLGAEAAAAANKFAASRQGLQLATLAQASDIAKGQANVLEEMGPVIDATQAIQKKIKDATGQELTFREAFNANLARLTDNTQLQVDGAGVNQDALTALNKGQQALANTAGKSQEIIGEQIQTNSTLMKTYSTVADSIDSTLSKSTETFLKGLAEALPGSSLKEQIGGIEMFQTELKESGVLFDDTIKKLNTLTSGSASEKEKREALDTLIQQGVLDTNKTLTEGFAKALAGVADKNVSTQIEQGNITEEGGSSWQYIKDFFQSINPFNEGTGGFQDFGKGTAALLHDLEAVVPAKSPEGQLLAKASNGELSNVINSITKGFDPSAMAAATAGQQSAPPKVLQDLMTDMSSPNTSTQGNTNEDLSETINQTLQQLIQINSRQLTEIQKQVKATKGMNGNMMSNVGL
jgi:hypothetical protein